jgi:PAS domain S-box-containing protein
VAAVGGLTPLKLVFAYTVAGLGWIYTSDYLVEWIAGDTPFEDRLQNLKGTFFVVVTGLCLYAVTAWYVRRILRFEKALVAGEAQYRALLEQASDGIFIFNREGSVIAVNASACEMMKSSYAQLKGARAEDLVIPEIGRANPLDWPRLLEGEGLLGECSMRRGDGDVVPVEINAKMLDDGRIQAIARDISQRKKAEEELASRTRDLDARVRQMNCLYAIARFLRPDSIDPREILQQVVNQVPHGWCHADAAYARLVFDGHSYDSGRILQPALRMMSELVVRGQCRGWLEVGYVEPHPPTEIQVFTEPERELLDLIAANVAEFLDFQQTQEDLRATRERLQAVFDATPLAVVMLDLNGRVSSWNPAAERIFGWKSEELVGRPYPLFPDNDRDASLKHLRERCSKGIFQSQEVRRCKDGALLEVCLTTAPIQDAEGRDVGIVGVLEDITQQRKVERRFSALVQHSSDIIGIVDSEGVIRYASPSVQDVLGYSPEQITALPAVSFLHGEDALETMRAFQRTVESPSGLATTLIHRARHADGTWTTLESVFSNEATDVLGGLVVNSRDLTERRRLEEQFRRAQKMEAMGRLAGGIAHDFNNLLMAISGYAEMLLLALPKDTPEQEDVLEITAAVDRGATLVRQLLSFSRRKEPKLEELDMNNVVSSLLRLLGRTLGSEIELTASLDNELPPTRADLGQMEQVIINLAVNARDAMSHNGHLHIETSVVGLDSDYPAVLAGRAAEQFVRLSVSDDGCGMTDEVRARIFEPFFTTKQEGQGTGLGLATVYSIVEDHGGVIQVDSELGRGTAFHIYLPTSPNHSE